LTDKLPMVAEHLDAARAAITELTSDLVLTMRKDVGVSG
jgi:hypothetical protein